MTVKDALTEEAWAKELDSRSERAAKEFKAFIKTVAELRHPVRGCPWDLEQSHASLRRYMIEEAYEAAETMGGEASPELIEELGDVLLQVVLNSQLTVEAGKGDIEAVVRGIREKMIRRHPHVFAPAKAGISSDEVSAQWSAIKTEEKAKNNLGTKAAGLFSKAKKVHPALSQSFQIGKIAKKIQFDWHSPEEVFIQLQSELSELQEEMKADKDKNGANRARIADELSDCFFSLAQLSRHLGLEPEDIAQQGNSKFLRRFETMERLAEVKGIDISTIGQQSLEELWKEAKESLKSSAKP